MRHDIRHAERCFQLEGKCVSSEAVLVEAGHRPLRTEEQQAAELVVGDDVAVERDGTLRLGRVVAFDDSTRVALRTSLHGIPVEVRRVGMEVEFGDGSRVVDAAHVQAAGWHCPVCLRTSPHGVPRERPCPRCLRRFRAGFDRWRETALARRRLRRRLARLTSEPAPFAPRRYPAYREAEAQLDDELPELPVAHVGAEPPVEAADHLGGAVIVGQKRRLAAV
jgi:hypothetical protein